MPAESSNSASHNQVRARSYRILDNARRQAARRNGYNSTETRSQLTAAFRERFGMTPHIWQLDVTESILVGLDSIVIAGTGAGKTMPFMMPLLLDEEKRIIIISPLKVLQEDQVCHDTFIFLSQSQSTLQATRFRKMGLTAKAVNGDTWDSKLQKVSHIISDIYYTLHIN